MKLYFSPILTISGMSMSDTPSIKDLKPGEVVKLSSEGGVNIVATDPVKQSEEQGWVVMIIDELGVPHMLDEKIPFIR